MVHYSLMPAQAYTGMQGALTAPCMLLMSYYAYASPLCASEIGLST